jgi:hypothetical protein
MAWLFALRGRKQKKKGRETHKSHFAAFLLLLIDLK